MINKNQSLIIKNNKIILKVMIEEIQNTYRIYYSEKENNNKPSFVSNKYFTENERILYTPFVFIKSCKNINETLEFIKKDFVEKYEKYTIIDLDSLGIFTVNDLLNIFQINIGCNFDKYFENVIIYTDNKGNGKGVFIDNKIKIEIKNGLKDNAYLANLRKLE